MDFSFTVVVIICLLVLVVVFGTSVFKESNVKRGEAVKAYASAHKLILHDSSIVNIFNKYDIYGLEEPFAGFEEILSDNKKVYFAEAPGCSFCAVVDSAVDIPEFCMCIENYDDNIYMQMGFEDIDYDEDKLFSDTFYLRSPKRELIDKLFVASVRQSSLELFGKRGMKVYAKSDVIIVSVSPNIKLGAFPALQTNILRFHDIIAEQLKNMNAKSKELKA